MPSDPENVESTLLRAFVDAGGEGFELERVIPGRRFLLVHLRSPSGELCGGLASARISEITPASTSAGEIASGLRSSDIAEASLAIATINAVLNRPYAGAAAVDGVDWLLEAGRGRHVALVGRFPFIEDEIRPVAGEISVFELQPREGEFGSGDIPARLPRADVIAVTATTILNHTLDRILRHRGPQAQLLLLGPTTPLTPALFPLGIHRLAGVAVRDLERVTRDVETGASFRRMGGTARVTLAKTGG